jgi:predicted HD phosphohydrolase
MRTLSSVDQVLALLESGGGEAYFGEPVTVLEHSLQAAWFVQRQGAASALIAAALLHDLGHLLHTEGEDVAVRGVDTQHEALGVNALGDHLPASVLDPIRLHVAAKRFAEPAYLAALSPASQQSLALQGGPMSAAKSEGFLALAHARQTITLRRADDTAKISNPKVPTLDAYRELIQDLWH